MQTSVTFKKIDASDHLRDYVAGKLDRFDKYLYNPAEASVVLSVEKFRHICEIHIVGDRLDIKGKEETNDMYSSIDMVLDKLETQIKKNKQKTRGHRGAGSPKKMPIPMEIDELAAEDDRAADRVQVRPIDYKPMDVDEAIMQMDLSTDIFMVFTNARTDQVNVLYRRSNGDYGLIQPAS